MPSLHGLLYLRNTIAVGGHGEDTRLKQQVVAAAEPAASSKLKKTGVLRVSKTENRVFGYQEFDTKKYRIAIFFFVKIDFTEFFFRELTSLPRLSSITSPGEPPWNERE